MEKKKLIMERLAELKRLTKELTIELPVKKVLQLFELAQIINANEGTGFRIAIENGKFAIEYSKCYTLDSIEVIEKGSICDPIININIDTKDSIDAGTEIFVKLNWNKWQMKECINLLREASKKSDIIKMHLTLMEKIPRCLSCENTYPKDLFIIE